MALGDSPIVGPRYNYFAASAERDHALIVVIKLLVVSMELKRLAEL